MVYSVFKERWGLLIAALLASGFLIELGARGGGGGHGGGGHGGGGFHGGGGGRGFGGGGRGFGGGGAHRSGGRVAGHGSGARHSAAGRHGGGGRGHNAHGRGGHGGRGYGRGGRGWGYGGWYGGWGYGWGWWGVPWAWGWGFGLLSGIGYAYCIPQQAVTQVYNNYYPYWGYGVGVGQELDELAQDDKWDEVESRLAQLRTKYRAELKKLRDAKSDDNERITALEDKLAKIELHLAGLQDKQPAEKPAGAPAAQG
jgi:hypothetical protein